MKSLVLILLFSSCVWAQTAAVPGDATTPAGNAAKPADDDGFPIAIDDTVDVSVAGAPEFGGSPRVNSSGYITLPIIGGFKAAGQNSIALAREIEVALEKKYLVDPNVVVSVKERASGQVSVLGAVRSPGVVPVKGKKDLLDLLAAVGGPTENAGKTIQIHRKKAGVDGAAVSPEGDFPENDRQLIEVSTEELFQRGKTDLNIHIYPGDVVNVLQTASIFVVGEVKTPGEMPLKFGKGITVRTAIAMAGNFNKEAKKEECKIIRTYADGTQEEIPMNLKKIMDASTDDVPLMPNDILFVPSSKAKNALNKTLDIAIGVVTQRVIYIGR